MMNVLKGNPVRVSDVSISRFGTDNSQGSDCKHAPQSKLLLQRYFQPYHHRNGNDQNEEIRDDVADSCGDVNGRSIDARPRSDGRIPSPGKRSTWED